MEHRRFSWEFENKGGIALGTERAIRHVQLQLQLQLLRYIPSIYLSMPSHSVLPTERRYRTCDFWRGG
jgi:hypothetical protein